MELSGLLVLVGGGEEAMTVAEILLLVSGYYSDAHGCSNQTIYTT